MKSKIVAICLILFCYLLIAPQSPAQALYPYPISGYFAYDPGYNNWPGTLQRIQRLGGNKIIQYGHYPEIKSEASIKQDPVFRHFVITGKHCIDYIRDRLKAYNPNNTIKAIFTFSPRENFGYSLYGSGLDKKMYITVNGQMYAFWVLVFSASKPNQWPNFYSGESYNLILVGGNYNDSVSELLQQASQMNIEVYVGLPRAPHHLNHPDYVWKVWEEYTPLCLAFTKRILKDYKIRHATYKSFVGVYQTFETPLQDSPQHKPIPQVIQLYKDQHALVHSELPGKKVLVSPYWDARKNVSCGQEAFSIKGGFKAIAQTNVDIIAPQDGRGTGKVGLFWPYQENDMVPSELQTVVGAITYGAAYYANTRKFYQVCHEAVNELANQNITVSLWANVEAFEPAGSDTACPGTGFPRTNKKRLDQALTFDGTFVSDQICHMWSFFLCKEHYYDKSLEEQIQADWRRPILVEAFRWYNNNLNGVIIRGYNIATGYIHFTYYSSSWQIREKIVPVSSGWLNPTYGMNNNRNYLLQEIWVPFDWNNMAPDFWLHIASKNQFGLISNHTYSLGYGKNDGLMKIQEDIAAEQPRFTLPADFELSQNYPNPFNPSTTINYSLPKAVYVRISVYDVLGRKLSDLVDAEMPAGSHQVEFVNQNCPSGVYFYTMESGNFRAVRKMIILK